MLLVQDLVGAIDEVDVVKFTDIVRDYDNMSRIVRSFPILLSLQLVTAWCYLLFLKL